MESSAMEVSTLLLVIVLIVLFTWLWNRGSDLPPGPRGLPLLGFFPFLGPGPLHKLLSKMGLQYGEVLSFRTIGGRLVVVFGSVGAIKEALVTRADEFNGRPLSTHLLSWVGLGFAELEGPDWKEQKRFFLQAVKDLGFGKLDMEARIQEEVRRLVEGFQEKAGKAFNPMPQASRAAGCIISEVLFGRGFENDDKWFRDLSSGLNRLFTAFVDSRLFLFGPLLEYGSWLYPGAREAAEARRTVEELVSGFIEDHLSSPNDHQPRDFVEAFLAHRRKLAEKGELQGSSFTLDRLKRVSMNMLMEGTESVGVTLCSLLRKLAQHPEDQIKAREELDTVVGKERLTSWLDRARLPYLEALLQELYRTAQVFNISTVYSNFEETTFRGYRIPKRSVIVANLWAANNDSGNFPDPSRFDPTRFLSPDGKRIKRDGPFPFGLGKRACVGESLAQMEVFLVVASILQNFTILSGGINNEQEIRALSRTD